MVRRVDRSPNNSNDYSHGGAHYDPLPMCADCVNTSLVRVLRADGWANLCKDCYILHHSGGIKPQKINEWKGPTAYGSKISREIQAKLRSFVHRTPSKEWAPRLLERVAAGEKISSYAVEMALEVTGAQRPREPGEDDA